MLTLHHVGRLDDIIFTYMGEVVATNIEKGRKLSKDFRNSTINVHYCMIYTQMKNTLHALPCKIKQRKLSKLEETVRQCKTLLF